MSSATQKIAEEYIGGRVRHLQRIRLTDYAGPKIYLSREWRYLRGLKQRIGWETVCRIAIEILTGGAKGKGVFCGAAIQVGNACSIRSDQAGHQIDHVSHLRTIELRAITSDLCQCASPTRRCGTIMRLTARTGVRRGTRLLPNSSLLNVQRAAALAQNGAVQ